MKYNSLTIKKPEQLIFGDAPLKVKTNRGLLIGSGCVYPEINFTLPPMEVSQKTLPEVRKHYREIVEIMLPEIGDAIILSEYGL
jgi:methanol--5-hydroxybenzimidazolylcobamide Co-methyltransferase